MRILIVEDSVLLREGLSRLLADAGHEVVAALPDASRALEKVADLVPDLAIVDVRLPPTFTDEGIRAALGLRKQDPSQAVLVLSQYVEERYASDLIAQQGGAVGYLLKDRVTDVADFLESVERIHEGATVLDPEVVAQLFARRSRDEKIGRLTERERSVLSLIAEGKSNAAISRLLFVSEGAVEKHITSIFQKLDLEHGQHGNRRVLAVLAHIDATAAPGPVGPSAPQNGTHR
ncbi:response regulator transcription factor [Microbacterium sp. G2-8]|uniref:response regulator transcription factor n=1 Tax=Microbacterium sp. G2-8 TaxID=2842454 RepID=UPI001C896949|nr:response regulator transcription factor [Microbacterium sp. G2-8]